MLDTADIDIQLTTQSRLSELDVNNLPFGKIFSDHMLVADYKNGQWGKAQIMPYGALQMSPAISALHYGQSIFEGMKAFKSAEGEILLLRPLENYQRMVYSAERMCMPAIPESIFMDGLKQLLRIDKDWILPNDGCSLYIRPIFFATDEALGVKVSESYRFIVFTSPVGAYYRDPVNVLFETHYSRACEGGVGAAKAAGNYGASLMPTLEANRKGYHQLIWTDAREHKYIEESGVMNVMFLLDGKLITPTLDSNSILPGTTRSAILTLARDWGMEVQERKISVDDILVGLENGKLTEGFGTGTAATVAPFRKIGHGEKEFMLPAITDQSLSRRLEKEMSGIKRGIIADRFNWIVKV